MEPINHNDLTKHLHKFTIFLLLITPNAKGTGLEKYILESMLFSKLVWKTLQPPLIDWKEIFEFERLFYQNFVRILATFLHQGLYVAEKC